jgi:folate-binding Fe-S cluster repair protein YgfZ
MSDLFIHLPAERGLIAVTGEDRQAFLQGLISNDTAKIGPAQAIYATLLTAQGRFLFDLFIAERGDGYLVDCATDRRAELIKRLSMYRLRAKVAIADAGGEWCVALLFRSGLSKMGAAEAVGLDPVAGKAMAYGGGIAYVDPRLPGST